MSDLENRIKTYLWEEHGLGLTEEEVYDFIEDARIADRDYFTSRGKEIVRLGKILEQVERIRFEYGQKPYEDAEGYEIWSALDDALQGVKRDDS